MSPTRDQVRAALAAGWHETGRVEVLTLERMVDAVGALLSETQPQVLWEGTAQHLTIARDEYGTVGLAVPLSSRVRVVAAGGDGDGETTDA